MPGAAAEHDTDAVTSVLGWAPADDERKALTAQLQRAVGAVRQANISLFEVEPRNYERLLRAGLEP